MEEILVGYKQIMCLFGLALALNILAVPYIQRWYGCVLLTLAGAVNLIAVTLLLFKV